MLLLDGGRKIKINIKMWHDGIATDIP